MDAASFPVVLAQVSEVTGVANGLEKNPITYICALLLFTVLFLYREVRTEQGKRFTESEAHSAEIKALYKELIPLTSQVTSAVGELGRIVDRLDTRGKP